MAKIILAIPEDALWDVIDIIRGGLSLAETYDSPQQLQERKFIIEHLTKWCDEHEEYLERLEEE